MLIETLDVKPAIGKVRADLISNCQGLLSNRQTMQIAEFEQFNEYMIKLMGGVYDPSVYGTYIHTPWQNNGIANLIGGHGSEHQSFLTTPWMIDQEQERAIQLTKTLGSASDTSILVAPVWEALPRKERDAVFNDQTEPVMYERIGSRYTYGLKGTESPHAAVVRRSFVFPKPVSWRFMSYASGAQYEVREQICSTEESHFGVMPKTLSNRILSVFMHNEQ